jgi:hypothetical protein
VAFWSLGRLWVEERAPLVVGGSGLEAAAAVACCISIGGIGSVEWLSPVSPFAGGAMMGGN